MSLIPQLSRDAPIERGLPETPEAKDAHRRGGAANAGDSGHCAAVNDVGRGWSRGRAGGASNPSVPVDSGIVS